MSITVVKCAKFNVLSISRNVAKSSLVGLAQSTIHAGSQRNPV